MFLSSPPHGGTLDNGNYHCRSIVSIQSPAWGDTQPEQHQHRDVRFYPVPRMGGHLARSHNPPGCSRFYPVPRMGGPSSVPSCVLR